MASKGMICTTNQVDYMALRKAQILGARSIEELKASTGICGVCDGCRENLDYITTMLCGCKQVTFDQVVTALRQGAGSVDEVVAITGAGTDCGKCKSLVANVVEIGR